MNSAHVISSSSQHPNVKYRLVKKTVILDLLFPAMLIGMVFPVTFILVDLMEQTKELIFSEGEFI